MKPYSTFIKHNGIKVITALSKGVDTVSNGKIYHSPFDIDVPYVGSSVKIIKETEDATFIAKYDSNGKINGQGFKILVTTDLHLGEEADLTEKALSMLAKHIAAEKPDLVIFTGDTVQTKYQQFDCIRFGRFMEKTGVYWAYIFGNHEAREEKEYHKYFMLKNLSSFPHCLSKFGDDRLFGYGNFMINIMGSETSVLQSLFLFDSGRDIINSYRLEYNLPEDMNGYDFLKNNQINWYKRSITSLRKEYGDFKSMMFMHIPLCEYKEVFDFDEENKTATPTGKAEILYGSMYESVGCSAYNSGMFKAIKEMNSTQAVFAGHDHVNDFCALYDGVYLIYGQCDGYETYTMEEKTGWEEPDWIQGVTVVNIGQDGSANFKQKFNRDYL